MHGSGEIINLGYYGGKVVGTILGNIDRIALGIDVGIELGYLYGLFDGYNYVNSEVFFL